MTMRAGSCWFAALERHGHKCLTPVLPLQDAAASFEDYAAFVLDCLHGRDAPVLFGGGGALGTR